MPDKVTVDLYVFHPLMEGRIFGDLDGTHLIGIGVIEVSVSSWSNLFNYDSSATWHRRLLYSVYVDDKEIVTCFLDFQVMRVFPRKTMKPMADFLL